MLRAAERAASILDRGSGAFASDWTLLAAAERMLEIIGEAARHLDGEATQQMSDVPWSRLRGMRNFLAHEYHHVRAEVIWRTLAADIPPLIQQLRAAMDNVSPE
ncbi:DUF86 domain-containing protein [Candidatus Poriferisodalis sp.]|uniref:HepT-like ribonuclease domain-containing protein n=1 Tax=Candidatus Poriferisodalis sp. TaxID=3101277 RepID=UPI003AF73C32